MIRKLEQSEGTVIGFSVSGDVGDEEYTRMISQMRDEIAKHDTIRVLLRIDDVSPKSFLTGLRERFDFATDHADDIDRIAVVTDSAAAGLFGAVSGLVPHIDIDVFSTEEEEKAWKWLQ